MYWHAVTCNIVVQRSNRLPTENFTEKKQPIKYYFPKHTCNLLFHQLNTYIITVAGYITFDIYTQLLYWIFILSFKIFCLHFKIKSSWRLLIFFIIFILDRYGSSTYIKEKEERCNVLTRYKVETVHLKTVTRLLDLCFSFLNLTCKVDFFIHK